jgi:hypothetical protein
MNAKKTGRNSTTSKKYDVNGVPGNIQVFTTQTALNTQPTEMHPDGLSVRLYRIWIFFFFPGTSCKKSTGSRIRAYKYRFRCQKAPDPGSATLRASRYRSRGKKSTGSRIRNNGYNYWYRYRCQKCTGSRIRNTAYKYRSRGQKSTGSRIPNTACKYRYQLEPFCFGTH